MTYKYAFEGYNKELMSRAVGNSLGISTKQSIEICNFVRRKPVVRAKKILENVINEKEAIPFKRFNSDVGHKPGIGPGRYPKKASEAILSLIKAAEANAQFKGLNTSNMVIKHICAHKASTPWHHGRQRGVKMKKTHVEIVLEETKKQDPKSESKKTKPKKVEVKETEETQKVSQSKVEKSKIETIEKPKVVKEEPKTEVNAPKKESTVEESKKEEVKVEPKTEAVTPKEETPVEESKKEAQEDKQK
ncbi:50S ribosomal protein L22 [Candidatus Woesearchaeota archaeon]|jgi:large subunit ribosomal protein L22|nr:50S ribosomal protein L22 [Candidatus Woesearchaeota archaeon]